ncbi:MAG: hypothetical protein OXC10_00615 [Rhodospirillaceae bacterium]|nr:hypothetical protein [Rhodospirillaceae bacterium]
MIAGDECGVAGARKRVPNEAERPRVVVYNQDGRLFAVPAGRQGAVAGGAGCRGGVRGRRDGEGEPGALVSALPVSDGVVIGLFDGCRVRF